ncbi:hypothetical protein ACQUQU_05360 [Thalassolituus sp. LLYu03]|uniref:hypothetical protein n=1 Tax=Thalassolituus sp. LLYu03 TaxID=3421656 RepID=UPI003D26B71B
MSTLTLVILAVVTAIAAVGALWFLRWQEQKKLERARLAVAHSDTIGEIVLIGETLQAWMSGPCMLYLASQIQHHLMKLGELRIAPDPRANRAAELAAVWQNHRTSGQTPLPAQPKQAQDMRTLLQRLIEHVKKDYQSHQLPADQARVILSEAKFLNIRLAVTVFQSKATAAIHLSNTSQAIHYLRKALAALKTPDPLPDELTRLSERLNEQLQEQLQVSQQNRGGTRLEEGTELLAAEEDAWKKKTF